MKYRVYWVIFCWPLSPSFWSASSRGITTVISCRMMLAVMYGMMPSAKTAKRVSAPPANRLRKSSRRLPRSSIAVWRASRLTPGTGTYEPKR